jgi:hypothetical protein
MTKALPHGSGFPWGLLVQAVILLVALAEEIIERRAKAKMNEGDVPR